MSQIARAYGRRQPNLLANEFDDFSHGHQIAVYLSMIFDVTGSGLPLANKPAILDLGVS